LKKVLAPVSKWQDYAATDTKIGNCGALYVKRGEWVPCCVDLHGPDCCAFHSSGSICVL
jgi:hypothetical protein